MRAHTMQSMANWRYSSALDMLPSSSHIGGSATGLSVTNAQGSPIGDAQVCASLATIAITSSARASSGGDDRQRQAAEVAG
jgi:hypothetical protein